MNTIEVLAAAERAVAPLSLSDEFCKKYGAYDNSGIIFDAAAEITGALFALDLTMSAARQAADSGCNLVLTHHPAIFTGIKHLSARPGEPTSALAFCIAHGISVISMHLNFDAAPHGIDYMLMHGLGGEGEEAVLNTLSGGGYGRVYEVRTQPFASFCKAAAEEFSTARCRFYGDGVVKRVASFCGAGCDEESIAFAAAHGADTFVSADMKHHHIAALLQAGMKVVEMTHYASEFYGFSRIYDRIKGVYPFPCALRREDALL